MVIRSMEAKDKVAVLDMMTGFYASPAILHKPPISVLERDIDDCVGDMPFVEGYVFEADCGIVGYLMVSKGYSTEYGGLNIMVEDLFVKPDYRGRKAGETFLKWLENEYKGKAVRIRLEVEPSNIGAIRLYERCGFTELPYKQMCKEI